MECSAAIKEMSDEAHRLSERLVLLARDKRTGNELREVAAKLSYLARHVFALSAASKGKA